MSNFSFIIFKLYVFSINITHIAQNTNIIDNFFNLDNYNLFIYFLSKILEFIYFIFEADINSLLIK